ncbi:MAG: hypothetical protein IKH45_03550 [Neisseriaceae bacterium]|nr:hypothetical protein [Neisseriaceae bacterium]
MKNNLFILVLISSLLSGCTYGLAFIAMATPVKEVNYCEHFFRLDNNKKETATVGCRIFDECEYDPNGKDRNHIAQSTYKCFEKKGYKWGYSDSKSYCGMYYDKDPECENNPKKILYDN